LARKQTHQELGQKLRQIAITSSTWTNVIEKDGHELCYLICGSKSGYLYFFKLVIFQNQIELTFDSGWNANMGLFSSLFWFKNNLIMCPANGQVILIKLNLDNTTLVCNEIGFAPRAYAWNEMDGAGVTHLVTRNVSKNQFSVIFAKNTYIIVSHIEERSVARKEIFFVNRVITADVTYGMSCSGLSLLPSSKFLITSNNCIVEAELNDSKITQKSYKKHEFDFNNMSPFGIDTSPNHLLTCLVQTVSKFHDHLFLKEPTKLRIFPSKL